MRGRPATRRSCREDGVAMTTAAMMQSIHLMKIRSEIHGHANVSKIERREDMRLSTLVTM